ncbi:hypothetical protein D3C85_1896490 [compost metagenome]
MSSGSKIITENVARAAKISSVVKERFDSASFRSSLMEERAPERLKFFSFTKKTAISAAIRTMPPENRNASRLPM